jgi:hypothetical protein
MSRLSEAQEKYPNLNWDTLKSFDPSKNHKYLDWLGKNAATNPKDLNKLIVEFEKRRDSLKEKDIYKYTATALKESLEKLNPSRKEQKITGATEITGDNIPSDMKIYFIEGEGAVKQYFSGTRWCVSDFGTFREYCEDGNFYLVIKNGQKICLHVQRNNYVEIFDPTDNELDDDSVKFLLKFAGINADIIGICKAHYRKCKNFWMNTMPLNKENIVRIMSLSDDPMLTLLENYDYSGDEDDSPQNVLKFLFKNKKDPVYQKLIESFTGNSKLAKSKYYFNLWEDSDDEVSLYLSLKDYWKELENPRPRTKAKKLTTAEKINKIGVSNLMKNKKIRDFLAKKIKEEYPELG